MKEVLFDMVEAAGLLVGSAVVILVCLALVAGFTLLLNGDWRIPK